MTGRTPWQSLSHKATEEQVAAERFILDEKLASAVPGGDPCPTCRGTGGGRFNDCPACDGNGVV